MKNDISKKQMERITILTSKETKQALVERADSLGISMSSLIKLYIADGLKNG